MNVNTALLRRRAGFSQRVDIDFAIDQMRLKEAVRLFSTHNPTEEDLKTYGPLACTRLNSNRVAVANEDGLINVISIGDLKETGNWLGHENAIFDIKALPDGKTLLSASGDTTIKHWDVETRKELRSLTPHFSSIKSISVYDRNTIASGSRDGTIKVHDIRRKDATAIVIRDAHRNYVISKTRRTSTKTDPISCVTNVVFDQYIPRIYSTGANDATIKLWDLRKGTHSGRVRRTYDGQIVVSQPTAEIHHPSKGLHCGYSHLLVADCKIYAACSDNKIYCYDSFSDKEMPTKYTGYQYDTYLKLAVMDDRFLFSGSKGGGAIVWTLGHKNSSKYFPETTKQPIGQLRPDDMERFDTNVIETDWDSLSLLTFRDDRLVCKWTMQHVKDTERRKLATEAGLQSQENDISIQMSDIMDVNVLRPNNRISNALTNE